jgi:hypothetical protein
MQHELADPENIGLFGLGGCNVSGGKRLEVGLKGGF